MAQKPSIPKGTGCFWALQIFNFRVNQLVS